MRPCLFAFPYSFIPAAKVLRNTHTCPPHVSLSGDGLRAERRSGRALVQLTSSLLSSPPLSNRALPCRQAS
ncbi:hypothetical protein AMECASPLE_036878 [Ameca splendens]|uniref:Uncharacterized protein n=1 Tax=Ameca splendens TaxID=208324 RepID=A0ABV0Z5N8_9TELE